MNDLVRRCWLASLFFAVTALTGDFASAAEPKAATEVRIFQIQGRVEIMPSGASTWVLTQTNQALHAGDRVRTGPDSRVVLRWSDQSVVPFGAETEIEILMPDKPDSLPGLNLFKGIISFFHRDKPGRIRVLTRGAAASVEGTEFVLEVQETNDGERVMLAVMDGKVQFSNAQGSLTLTNLEQAVAAPGRAPARTAGFVANNLLQWCFYYPAVLDLDDLGLSSDEVQQLKASLGAYRSGDLLNALARYPASRSPGSDAEHIYHAALLLSVGQVEQTEAALARLQVTGTNQRLANSLRTLIAAVKRQPNPTTLHSQRSTNAPHATELLAASYYEQSRATGDESLNAALELARRATTVSPEFGFAWERVAELEFGFGRVGEASRALDRSLELSPRNSQALALKGFMLAGRNKMSEAIQWFDRAIAVDGALGNAWLGRGLCRIRRGDTFGGREDLMMATALEPQRALLRSYLAKAYAATGDTEQARHELALARQLDPADPTAWLYSALLNEQHNRFNEGIRDLEKSQELNDNRRLYRSRLLLDEDRAVRSSSLAALYEEAGMPQVSVREAARSVSYDYANYAAHLFMAESFDNLRDPTRFNLRYETPWFNELLLANLLSPVGGTPLSQNVSQHEYARLFDQNHVGLASTTEYRSDGQVRELGSQYGNIGNTGWSLDVDYQHNDGVRPNNELERLEWYTTVKQQITAHDSVMLLAKYQNYTAGDNFQYYYPTNARPNFQFEEEQQPILLAGYHHEWQPGVHTLLLGGRLVNDQKFSDLQAPQLLLIEDGSGAVVAADSQPFDVQLTDDLEIYTAELNQIVQREKFTVVAGALWQDGSFDFANSLTNTTLPSFFLPPVSTSYSESFGRFKGYGYLTVEPIEKLALTGGVAYDQVTMPVNFRQPPVSSGDETRSLWEPKAALVWSPFEKATVRGIYAQSLGGVSLDESYRLEPAQLAGFPQAYRSVISESIAGSVAAPEFETFGLALDLNLGHGTYAGIRVEQINSSVQRQLGVFVLEDGIAPFVPGTTPENLDYTERSLEFTLNQLVGNDFALGLLYRYVSADLQTTLPDVPVSVLSAADQTVTSDLHQVSAYALFNHPKGWFARFEANWYHQQNTGFTPAQPGDDLVQLNLLAGYQFTRQRFALTVGILNLTDQDYQLNPLTIYSDLPRERVFYTRLSFRF